MELGSQDIQELTGYIEEMFSEYMTFPTILFIVAIVVALSSIACFILATVSYTHLTLPTT